MRNKLRRYNPNLIIKPHQRTRRLRLLGRHPLAVPIATLVFLLLCTGAVLGWLHQHRARRTLPETQIVIISYDHQTQTVPSNEPTVGALLTKLHIPLHPGDVVEPSRSEAINQDDFRINIYRAVPVKIIDGDQATFAYSAATTPRSITAQAGITDYPEDKLTSRPVTNFLQERTIGQTIVITRSTPITIDLYGTLAPTRTLAKTVGGMLGEKHITLGKGDTVSPALATPITPNMKIAVIHNGTKVVTAKQPIATPVQTIHDASLAYGTSAVRQQGSPGEELVTYKVTVKNGHEVSRHVLQTVVIKEPVTQIVVEGTNLSGIKGDMALAGIAPGDYQYADYIISHESGWCPTKAQGQYGSCPAYSGSVPAYGGYGLCQATPGGKMSSAGSDWATNPITQLRWCSGYAHSRYGSWYNAYIHWVNYHNW